MVMLIQCLLSKFLQVWHIVFLSTKPCIVFVVQPMLRLTCKDVLLPQNIICHFKSKFDNRGRMDEKLEARINQYALANIQKTIGIIHIDASIHLGWWHLSICQITINVLWSNSKAMFSVLRKVHVDFHLKVLVIIY